ncbi:MAG: EAL domain-containing protein [Candidatus Izemoplasmatales bacterium]|nr:EAL domain-containing protein [Candidatus Izemoplasmatales bacterium]
MNYDPFFLSEARQAQTYQVLVAILVIILTGVAFYFLFRNVIKDIRKEKEERKLVKKEESMAESPESDPVSHLVVERRTSNKKSGDLVGLINQKIFEAKEGAIGVFYYLNLDNFSFITEKYTEKEVTRVIEEIEKRLKKVAKTGMIVGHLKEDIFLYYLTGEIDTEMMVNVAEGLLKEVAIPLKAVNESITTSIGVCIFPYDGISAMQLIKNAEIALYVSKKEGKNRYYLYSQDLIEKEQFNMDYYQEIKRSSSNDEFLLYYQPIVDIKTAKIIGLESLLRWNHPAMGILPPGKFLNVMELTGDITWFGAWGFEKIVKQYVSWKKEMRIRDLFISTNLSPKQLLVEGLAKNFFDIVRKYDFLPENFCLEIIDYYTIIKSAVAMQNLADFRRYGFRVAIDDFGEEFEIIAQMAQIKASIIKVNREHTLKMMNGFEETDRIIRVIQEANKKQKIVIAESIENEEMIRKMIKTDVRFMQGYFFSPPKSAQDIGEILKKSPWSMDEFSRFQE